MQNNYDRIAWNYDFLSRLIFRRSLVNAQSWLLHYILPGSNLLIVGGGTGHILEELAKLHPNNITVTYVEISGKMIALARKMDTQQNQVHFIHQAIEEFNSTQRYDVIMTPFLFDNFTGNKIQTVFTKLDALLKPGGKWLFADFYLDKEQGKRWQKLLLKIMYKFFRLTCDIEAAELINMEPIFENNQYRKLAESAFYSGFIRSAVYTRGQAII